jgi:hypothetical protein
MALCLRRVWLPRIHLRKGSGVEVAVDPILCEAIVVDDEGAVVLAAAVDNRM